MERKVKEIYNTKGNPTPLEKGPQLKLKTKVEILVFE